MKKKKIFKVQKELLEVKNVTTKLKDRRNERAQELSKTAEHKEDKM